MSKQAKRQLFRRILAAALVVAACVALHALPLDWNGLARQAACLSAGIRQPYGAAAMMEQSLFDTPALPAGTVPSVPDDTPLYGLGADTGLLELPTAAPAVGLPEILSIDPPGNQKNGGKIVTRKMNTGDRSKHGIATVNRSGKKEDIPAALAAKLTQTFADTDAPQVLILHTHTTESYTQSSDRYEETSPYRTLDPGHNMIALGGIVAEILRDAGIGVIHDTAFHDYPSYNGSYSHAAAATKAYLEQYPTIELILDLHRDAADTPSGQLATRCSVGGETAAQLMFVLGTDERLEHPDWERNLGLALQLQTLLEQKNPGICRDVSMSRNRYNQHLGNYALLVEIGAAGNTLEQAKLAAQALGEAIAELVQ